MSTERLKKFEVVNAAGKTLAIIQPNTQLPHLPIATRNKLTKASALAFATGLAEGAKMLAGRTPEQVAADQDRQNKIRAKHRARLAKMVAQPAARYNELSDGGTCDGGTGVEGTVYAE